jgi:hypothetical protein
MVAKTKKQNSATPFMLRRPEPNSGGLGSRTNNGIDTSLDYLGLELVCTCKGGEISTVQIQASWSLQVLHLCVRRAVGIMLGKCAKIEKQQAKEAKKKRHKPDLGAKLAIMAP